MFNIIRDKDIPKGLKDTDECFKNEIMGMSIADAYNHYKKKKSTFKYNTTETKEVFKKMNFKRCSFCSQYIPDFSKAMTIEHVQLKSKCPEKIFEWYNLLCSCRPCNTARSTNDYDEKMYLDPTKVEEVDKYFLFTLDGSVNANEKLSKNEIGRAEYMIDLYDLNRDDLIYDRNKFLIELMEDDDYYEKLNKRDNSDNLIIFLSLFAYYRKGRK